MKVRLGVTLDGSPVRVDTVTEPVLLVSDQGCGKTTLSRYLTRWWIADRNRTARIFARRPHEYTDLMTNPAVAVHPLVDAHLPAHPAEQFGLLAERARQLTVIDDIDDLPTGAAARHLQATGWVVLTSTGPGARALDGSGHHRCLALTPRRPADAADPSVGLARHAWDGEQGRLDWPSELLTVIPDRRGQRDLPVHRWQLVESAAR